MNSPAGAITTPGAPRCEEVSEGIYAYIQPDGTWWINNTGFVVGPQGVTVIDTCSTERRTRAFRDTIATVTELPVRLVVTTHHHGDHTFGNALFGGAAILAHERTRTEAMAFGPARRLPHWNNPEWGELPLDPPFVTFSDRAAFHAGELRGEVIHVGTAAHTTNDSIIWFPDRSTLFCGDLVFHGGTPFLLMGSVVGALEVIQNVLMPMGARTTVPGHGPVFFDQSPLQETQDYLHFVLELAQRARAAGVSPLQAARDTDLGRFAAWPDSERIVGNLYRAYADLDGRERGAEIDIFAALDDMVTYHGGPLTCLA